MSDQWELYPCEMKGHQAFVAYDHGIKDEIDVLDLPWFLWIRVAFKSPSNEGLPQEAEYEALSALEDQIKDAVNQLKGVYVGRVTVAGHRYYHAFVKADQEAVAAVIASVSARSSYELRFSLKEDPDKDGYWEALFPTEAERQVMADMKVIDALRAQGDALEEPRPVEHWIYFKDRSALEAFIAWSKENGFHVKAVNEPHEEFSEFSVGLSHECVPTLREISSVTLMLSEQAEMMGGEYDGWETPLVKSND